jgi:hypothetical protein
MCSYRASSEEPLRHVHVVVRAGHVKRCAGAGVAQRQERSCSEARHAVERVCKLHGNSGPAGGGVTLTRGIKAAAPSYQPAPTRLWRR